MTPEQAKQTRRIRRATWIFIAIAAALSIFLYVKNLPPPNGTYDAFAKCIAHTSTTLYGATWCPHCHEQKNEFGNAAQYLPYVECSQNPGEENQVCIDKGISKYPTWQFPDGSTVAGVQSLETLSQKTGCLLSTSTPKYDMISSMTPFAQHFTDILSFLTLLADLFAVALFLLLVTPLKRRGWGKLVADFFGERAIFLSFLVALAATGGSLFYSEVVGFAPCVLCWWQRLFLYPQAILLFTAFIKKDENMRLHSIILSSVGALIAVYHTFIQFGGQSIVPCSATGPACTTLYFLEYGYITIPTMSLTVFVLLLLFMSAPNPKKKEVHEL